MAETSTIVTIRLIKPDGSYEKLEPFRVEKDVLAKLQEDFRNFVATGEPKTGTYTGADGTIAGFVRKTVTLRFDNVAAIS